MDNSHFPSPLEFLLKEPLYRPHIVEDKSCWLALDTLYFDQTYDSYCIACKRDSTFRGESETRPATLIRDPQADSMRKRNRLPEFFPRIPTGTYSVGGRCTRHQHLQFFIFLIEAHMEKTADEQFTRIVTLQKIGQFPSSADLTLPRVKHYAAVLGKELRGDLTRAIGLAAHDVGIGAYAYLRRVFEALIEQAHVEAAKESSWDDSTYQQSRMADKVKMLRTLLPEFLVQNPGMYSLLSKGIHELSEQDCLDSFPALLAGIELILDERLEKATKARRIAEATKAISEAQSKHT